MLCTLSGDISGVIGAPLFLPGAAPKESWSVGIGGGGGGAYWRGGMFVISCGVCCRGNVPDWGVRIGDEMLIPLTDFFFGDRSAERNDDVLDCRSSLVAFRFKLAGLDLSFLEEELE
jgi:hypothetical protein